MKAPPRTVVASLAAVALAIAAGAYWLWRAPTPAAPRQVPLSELVLRDGRLHWQDEAKPFTGVIFDRYLDGALKSRSTMVDGLLHGVSEGWHTNGVLQVREHFRHGVSHGLRTKWSPEGHKISEATIEDGKITGTFRRWHENGVLAEEVEMKDGQPHGRSRAFYPDGSLKAEARLESGRVLEQHFFRLGERPASALAQVNR
jgi:antitoxin component YwqK of YwqJK toxin-antitoxin module